MKLGIVGHICNLFLGDWKLRQEGCHEFEAILSYRVRHCLKKKKENRNMWCMPLILALRDRSGSLQVSGQPELHRLHTSTTKCLTTLAKTDIVAFDLLTQVLPP